MSARCEHFVGGDRCNAYATHAYAIHGEVSAVAGRVCEAHGRAVIAEYTAKIPEEGWGLVALDDEVSR